MELGNEQVKAYSKRLKDSRRRILWNYTFYGLLLMQITFSLDDTCPTACTDGSRIMIGPKFMDQISDSELDFVLMHEIMHVALQHCFRGGKLEDQSLFNIAADIVVNSNLLRSFDMKKEKITLKAYGESMHLAPDGKEGYLYSAEEVYHMLLKENRPNRWLTSLLWDNHFRWNSGNTPKYQGVTWLHRVKKITDMFSGSQGMNQKGDIPLGVTRMYKDLTDASVDWKKVLNNFIREDINDFSFLPPDRRFPDAPYFLPDYNAGETEDVRNVLFMVDTSGSISDQMLAVAFSEIKGAIEQYSGHLEGWLGFFDADVTPPVPFSCVSSLLKIKPKGGGGTSFFPIFRYVKDHMSQNPPSQIVILTDGEADFPKKSVSGGIPVLWLIMGSDVVPPWGESVKVPVSPSNQP